MMIFMKWDAKNVTGTINPGPKAVPLKSVTLDADKWTVHFEANGIVGDGKLEDVGSYNRTITGTWKQGDAQGNFKLTRD